MKLVGWLCGILVVAGTVSAPVVLVRSTRATVPAAVVVPARRTPAPSRTAPVASPPDITGRVVSLDGSPIHGARVTVSGHAATTDRAGWFRVPPAADPSGLPQWVSAGGSGFLSRTRAAAPGSPVLIRLSPKLPGSVSLNVLGEVSFGRRLFDPNQDGSTQDAILTPGAGVGAHLRLLQGIRPLMEDADITLADLETVLVSQPYFDPTRPRPARFHPTKIEVIASSLAAASALRRAGVDVVDLANNHLYDALDPGVDQTITALDRAGLLHFGGGLTDAQAWAPAVITVRGRSVAFLGCTTITGVNPPPGSPPSNVVSIPEHKGGAAECHTNHIRAAVTSARNKDYTVVFVIHGGQANDPSPTPGVKLWASIARKAGATLVVDHYPKVMGGFDWDGSSLVDWSVGNALYDQDLWPAMRSDILRVDLLGTSVAAASAEPVVLDGYLPRGVAGALADRVIREAAGRERGPFFVEDGAAVVDVGGSVIRRTATVHLKGPRGPGQVFRVGCGARARSVPAGHVDLGRDLLLVGSFEGETVGELRPNALFWDVHAGFDQVGQAAAYRGLGGVRFERDASNTGPGTLTTARRIPVRRGSEVSILGAVRVAGRTEPTVRLTLYRSTHGRAVGTRRFGVAGSQPDAWDGFRFDVHLPPGIGALRVTLVVPRPAGGIASAEFDDVALVDWARARARRAPALDYIRVHGRATVDVEADALPGGEAWADAAPPVAVRVGPLPPPPPERCGPEPPGPA